MVRLLSHTFRNWSRHKSVRFMVAFVKTIGLF